MQELLCPLPDQMAPKDQNTKKLVDGKIYKLNATHRQSMTFKGNCGKYFPHSDLFNSLHTVCLMYGLSIYEIKRICHRARFFTI